MIDIDFFFNSWEGYNETQTIEKIENVLGVKFSKTGEKYFDSCVLGTPLALEVDHDFDESSKLHFNRYKYRINVDSKSALTRSSLLAMFTCIATLLFKCEIAKMGMIVFDGQVLLESWSFSDRDEAFDTLDEETVEFDKLLSTLISKCGRPL